MNKDAVLFKSNASTSGMYLMEYKSKKTDNNPQITRMLMCIGECTLKVNRFDLMTNGSMTSVLTRNLKNNNMLVGSSMPIFFV